MSSNNTATSNGDKFLLLLWKNWIIQKRHYIQTIFEILIPVLCCSILLITRGLVDPKFIESPTVFEPGTIDRFYSMHNEGSYKYVVAYSPENPLLERIVAEAMVSISHYSGNFTYQGYPNARSMEAAQMSGNFFAGVEFDDSLVNTAELPEKLTFALRFPAELRTAFGLYPNWQTRLLMVPFSPRLRSSYDNYDYSPSYFREGFLTLQAAISKAIIRNRKADAEISPVFINRIPYPPYYDDPILEALEQLLSIIILLSFFYPCIVMVKHITIEKEKQLKEAMKIMGLPSWLHWSAWFVKNIILLFVSISLITILLCVSLNNSSLLEYSDWTAVWFFLFVYSIVTICFCFMMSVFFNKANMAAGIAGLMWFVFVMPYNVTVTNYDELSTGAKVGLGLFSNTAMSFGILSAMRMEAIQLGVQWSSLFTPATIDDGSSVGLMMIMMLVDAVIYLAIALYIEQVMPGEFGVAKPWNFLFKREYWGWGSQTDSTMPPRNGIQRQNSKYYEEEPTSGSVGVQIKNLRKVFAGNKVAVQGLNLRMYENQITILLGHNGAGKTTTMSMLTGMFSPTSGTAYLNGHDIRTDIEGVRQSLGLCPQHNVLFDEMTVGEHLQFFGRLKGVPKQQLSSEVDNYLKMLELEDKRNAQSRTLSGGMKRRLAVGMALCGGSKVVLLDEPTSGMDPSARRALWDLLQKEKKNRTILLSTHFMDEADVLGDRIAIMAEGILKTVGSPFFLKKTFGVGYRLICVKDYNCNKQQLCNILRHYIPDVKIETDIGSELSFVLREEYITVFQSMLEELESRMTECGITSYGISLTTMEEVFLKAGSDSLQDKDQENGTSVSIADQSYALSNMTLLTGTQLLVNQVKAQFLKKILSTIRSWAVMCIQVGIPIFFVVMTFVITRSISADKDLPPLTMSLSSYKETVTVLEGTPNDPKVLAYQQQFTKISGSHRLDTITDPMNDYILERSVQSISEVNTRYLVAATFNGENSTAWFNNKGYHTAPLAVSLMFNALLGSECPNCELTVVNKPLPFQLSTQFDNINTGVNSGFQLAFNTGFAMAFIAALYILFYIRERTSRAKLLQYVSGTNILLFWGVAFLWDFVTFIVTSLVYIATLAAFQEEGWSSFAELGRVFLLLLFFGIGFLPTTYISSFLFNTPATGFVIVMLLNIAAGSIFFTAVVLLKFPSFELEHVASGLEWFFMLFPNFALTHGMNNINQIVSTTSNCQKQCELLQLVSCDMKVMCLAEPKCCVPDVFSFDNLGIVRNLLFLLFVGASAFCLVLAFEYRLVERIMQKVRKSMLRQWTPPPSEEDSDVLTEKKRVQSMPFTDLRHYNLVMKDITKYYKSLLAVNKLSVAVDRGECFGLLGINGAGKTTTFKMMTGDESFTSGEAWVRGVSLRTNMNTVYQQIGYCPQFDALLEDLTGRETLKIYALLRGVRSSDVANVSMTLAEDLNFVKHINKKTKEYSGGNKRKLSTALALMGNPSVIYLDEPTTGMDPGAKRQFWDMICKVRSSGKSIVLTSHSMEECEALCTRLAIMVNGEFKCLGSTQHLKNKFSKGFLLTIKVKKTEDKQLQEKRIDDVKSFVTTKFDGAVMKEAYQDSISFHVPQTDLKWSAMFGLMESYKEQLNVEDYALGQTTLEQVFLFFTKYQRIE
ncbi:phospholipid-transporting ATPase ABCA3-like [Wyeomyia smithii]|uniref:phospholipid-transporting ATPase ABCA3-like n=1 Tax=Wyeomyia smithii TaxID=174621 RepID=UPI002467C70D|nr:phospholipid-transporting ATPase ABCA3-like [Wyeomyia smithii]XP_055535485.1 phospholipid-transporting ATPase ABCA3-like [Wyeomyia smithii]